MDSIACLFVALEADRPQVFYFIVNTNVKILLLSIGTYIFIDSENFMSIWRKTKKTWKVNSRKLWSNILNVNGSKKIDHTSAIIIETTYFFLDVFEFEKENSHEHNYFSGWTCNKSGSLIILIPAKLGDFGLWNFCSSSLMALIRGVATSWAPAPRTESVAWSWIRTCITVIQNFKKSFGNYLEKAKTTV